MKCDHPKSAVLESRRLGAVRFRKRECSDCYERFVTMERQEPGLKMPDGTQSRNRKKNNYRCWNCGAQTAPAPSRMCDKCRENSK